MHLRALGHGSRARHTIIKVVGASCLGAPGWACWIGQQVPMSRRAKCQGDRAGWTLLVECSAGGGDNWTLFCW